MGSKWADAVLQAVVFDSVSDKTPKNIHKWRTHIVSLVSLLHGVALADLGGGEHRMPTIEGVDKKCMEALNDPEVDDKVGTSTPHGRVAATSPSDAPGFPRQVFLVFQWVTDALVRRMKDDGLAVPPPICTRIFQELSNGMLGFNHAIKIHDTPFPFPYVQLITLQLLILTVTSGFVINVFVESPIWGCLFAIITVGGYYAINEVAKELEDPFGDDPNDLPMELYQYEFNCRLACCTSLNVGRFKTPKLDPATEQIYDMQEENVWEEIEGHGRLTKDEHVDYMREEHDRIQLRWIGAREVQDLVDLAKKMDAGTDLAADTSEKAAKLLQEIDTGGEGAGLPSMGVPMAEFGVPGMGPGGGRSV